MLDFAKKHEKDLQQLFADTTFDFKYLFAHCSVYRDDFKLPDSTFDLHSFVSLYGREIIGYISYNIRRIEGIVSGMCIEHFGKGYDYTFGRDVFCCIRDIFEKFRFNKIDFAVVIGNPVEKTYDRLVKRYGGRIVGIMEKDVRLMDGLLYDVKQYEILADNYFNSLTRGA